MLQNLPSAVLVIDAFMVKMAQINAASSTLCMLGNFAVLFLSSAVIFRKNLL